MFNNSGYFCWIGLATKYDYSSASDWIANGYFMDGSTYNYGKIGSEYPWYFDNPADKRDEVNTAIFNDHRRLHDAPSMRRYM